MNCPVSIWLVKTIRVRLYLLRVFFCWHVVQMHSAALVVYVGVRTAMLMRKPGYFSLKKNVRFALCYPQTSSVLATLSLGNWFSILRKTWISALRALYSASFRAR